jgi:hypothetical protein
VFPRMWITLVLLLVFFGLTGAMHKTTGLYVPNAAFEQAAPGNPTHAVAWTTWDNSWSVATRQVVTPHVNDWSMSFMSNHYGAQSYVASDPIPVSPFQNYSIGVTAEGCQPTSEYWLSIGARWMDQHKNVLDDTAGQAFVPGPSWASYATVVSPPVEAAYVILEVGLSGNQAGLACLYIDDVTLNESNLSN